MHACVFTLKRQRLGSIVPALVFTEGNCLKKKKFLLGKFVIRAELCNWMNK